MQKNSKLERFLHQYRRKKYGTLRLYRYFLLENIHDIPFLHTLTWQHSNSYEQHRLRLYLPKEHCDRNVLRI